MDRDRSQLRYGPQEEMESEYEASAVELWEEGQIGISHLDYISLDRYTKSWKTQLYHSVEGYCNSQVLSLRIPLHDFCYEINTFF